KRLDQGLVEGWSLPPSGEVARPGREGEVDADGEEPGVGFVGQEDVLEEGADVAPVRVGAAVTELGAVDVDRVDRLAEAERRGGVEERLLEAVDLAVDADVTDRGGKARVVRAHDVVVEVEIPEDTVERPRALVLCELEDVDRGAGDRDPGRSR